MSRPQSQIRPVPSAAGQFVSAGADGDAVGGLQKRVRTHTRLNGPDKNHHAFYLRKEVSNKLRVWCAHNDVTMSDTVEMALIEYFDRDRRLLRAP